MTEIVAALDALSTALPAHAGRGVANSIRRWVAYAPPRGQPSDPKQAPPDPEKVLNAQGELWRLLLTGEKKGGTIGKLAGGFEKPLWDAEIDGAVTDAITLVTTAPPKTTILKRRRDAQIAGDYAGRAARAIGRVTP